MPPETTVIVSDAHLSGEPGDPLAETFHRFLKEVPAMGRHLVINGDLFDFWFEYRSVIPRTVFPTLAALAEVVRAGVRVTITGGNHDRWGGRFWKEQLGAAFYPREVEIDVSGRRALVSHGDGDIEPEFMSKLVHRVIGNPATSFVFRAIHPDVGFWMVRKLSGLLGRRRDDDGGKGTAADAQVEYARELLELRKDLELVVLGHTHRAVVVEVAPGRWYVNPGAWMDRYEYALVTEDGPELRRF
ncbi:MAG: UDP-2,3-diacylglucosamine diphosphatase, partial [Gemmatimonadetes bacterium]|nr:UDP-2,3-diacylglucosamine diphosphatase [Gemmatimonadota bacterium]